MGAQRTKQWFSSDGQWRVDAIRGLSYDPYVRVYQRAKDVDGTLYWVKRSDEALLRSVIILLVDELIGGSPL